MSSFFAPYLPLTYKMILLSLSFPPVFFFTIYVLLTKPLSVCLHFSEQIYSPGYLSIAMSLSACLVHTPMSTSVSNLHSFFYLCQSALWFLHFTLLIPFAYFRIPELFAHSNIMSIAISLKTANCEIVVTTIFPA